MFVIVATSFSDLLTSEDFFGTSVDDQVMTSGSSSGGSPTIAIAVAVVIVLLFVIVAGVCVMLFLIW